MRIRCIGHVFAVGAPILSFATLLGGCFDFDALSADDESDGGAQHAMGTGGHKMDAAAPVPPPDAADEPPGSNPGCSPFDAAANLMRAQPAPSSWYGNGIADLNTHMTATTVCGQPATHWVQTNAPPDDWIYIFLDSAPFNSNLITGQSYSATFAIQGAAVDDSITIALDVWDGLGGPGKGDNRTPFLPITATTPTVFTQSFTQGTGMDPQIQVRWDQTGSTSASISVDLLIWNVAVYPN